MTRTVPCFNRTGPRPGLTSRYRAMAVISNRHAARLLFRRPSKPCRFRAQGRWLCVAVHEGTDCPVRRVWACTATAPAAGLRHGAVDARGWLRGSADQGGVEGFAGRVPAGEQQLADLDADGVAGRAGDDLH